MVSELIRYNKNVTSVAMETCCPTVKRIYILDSLDLLQLSGKFKGSTKKNFFNPIFGPV